MAVPNRQTSPEWQTETPKNRDRDQSVRMSRQMVYQGVLICLVLELSISYINGGHCSRHVTDKLSQSPQLFFNPCWWRELWIKFESYHKGTRTMENPTCGTSPPLELLHNYPSSFWVTSSLFGSKSICIHSVCQLHQGSHVSESKPQAFTPLKWSGL